MPHEPRTPARAKLHGAPGGPAGLAASESLPQFPRFLALLCAPGPTCFKANHRSRDAKTAASSEDTSMTAPPSPCFAERRQNLGLSQWTSLRKFMLVARAVSHDSSRCGLGDQTAHTRERLLSVRRTPVQQADAPDCRIRQGCGIRGSGHAHSAYLGPAYRGQRVSR